jgi:hypothetical protein
MINIPVSVGELLDKITILRIKLDNITDEAKCVNISKEHDLLTHLLETSIVPLTSQVSELFSRLEAVNRKLWDIEDAIRHHERRADWGNDFIDLARSVYINNDLRSKIKREINVLTSSDIIEEKSYTQY